MQAFNTRNSVLAPNTAPPCQLPQPVSRDRIPRTPRASTVECSYCASSSTSSLLPDCNAVCHLMLPWGCTWQTLASSQAIGPCSTAPVLTREDGFQAGPHPTCLSSSGAISRDLCRCLSNPCNDRTNPVFRQGHPALGEVRKHPVPYSMHTAIHCLDFHVALGPHGITPRRPDPWLRAISGTFYIYSKSIELNPRGLCFLSQQRPHCANEPLSAGF